MPKPLPPRPKSYLKPSVFWGIRQGFPVWLSILLIATALGLPLLAWTIASLSQWVPTMFLPTPLTVLLSGIQMFRDEDLMRDILASCGRVLLGFLAAALVGIPIGILMGTFSSMERLFIPIVGTVRYMPVAAFVPLIILWAGLEELSKVVIIFMGIVFFNALMIADAVKFIPSEMLNVAYTLGAKRHQVLMRVIFPAVMPSIIDTLRVNVAGAWNYLVISELVGADRGLGFRIVQAQRFVQTDKVLFSIIVIGAIGLLTDYLFKLLAKMITPWAE
ncbi:ABC transporter permease [Leptolyngbya sp. 'hensonii']|nr:ABC transporter permease [Leptolyngbya sp. 'hensonii']